MSRYDLKKVLAASGYRVVMTRDSDVFVPLGTRVAIANSNRNAIFVCIHFNSAGRSGASGIETYFYSREACRSLGNSSLCCRRRAFGEPRRAPPWLLRLAKDEHSGGARGVRFSDQPDRSCVRTKCFLSSKARRRNCSRSPRPQFRGEAVSGHDASRDS